MGTITHFHRPLLAGVAILIVGLMPTSSHAWGCEGHRTVAFVARAQLTDHARQQVDKLLRNNPIDSHLKRSCAPKKKPKERLTRFVDASTWADDIRKTHFDTFHSSSWHFLDIPRGATRDRVPQFCTADGCVTKAISDEITTLQGNATSKEKADALRFLIHFVGDIHQPLHCTTNSDRGGNCVPVKFFGDNASVSADGTAEPNLHAVWDKNMIQKDPAYTLPEPYAKNLRQQFQAQIPEWQAAGIDLDEWAWASHQFAESTSYGKMPTAIPVEPERGELKSCVVDGDNISERMLVFNEQLGQPYQDDSQLVIEEQLAKGGTRLALILNGIWP